MTEAPRRGRPATGAVRDQLLESLHTDAEVGRHLGILLEHAQDQIIERPRELLGSASMAPSPIASTWR
jgi:hypothetical protein